MGERGAARAAKATAKASQPTLLSFTQVPLTEQIEAQRFPEMPKLPPPSKRAIATALEDLKLNGRTEGVPLQAVDKSRRLKLINLDAHRQIRIGGKDAMIRLHALQRLKNEIENR